MEQRGCTQCGECLNVCPVFQELNREEYSPKAKRLLLEGLETGHGNADALSWERVKDLARMCTGCQRCARVCARGLSAADLLAEVRAANPHWSQYLWELWIRRLGPLWPAVGFAASLVPEGMLPESMQAAMAPAKILLEKNPVKPWLELVPPTSPPDTSRPVAIFGGCTSKRVRPSWAQKVRQLLTRFGYEVISQTDFACCGATMRHSGQIRAMRQMREQNIETWDKLGRPRIAFFCASCFHGLAEYAGDETNPSLFGGAEAQWKDSLVPLSVLLSGAQAKPKKNPPGTVGYHQPCHWGENDPDWPLLSGIIPSLQKGTGLCCGMGGVLKMSNPKLSMDIAATCLTGFPQDTKIIITGCSGCALQLSSATPKGLSVCHWLDAMC